MTAPASLLSLLELAHLSDCWTLTPADVAGAERIVTEALGRVGLWLPADSDDPWIEQLETCRQLRPEVSGDPVIDTLNQLGNIAPLGYDPVGYGAIAYPSATPLVSAVAPAALRDSRSVIVTGAIGYLTTVTYRGGWTASSLPFAVKAAIARLAAALNPYSGSENFAGSFPAGAQSVSVGDISVSFASGSVATAEGRGSTIDGLVPGLWPSIKRYRHKGQP